MPSPLPQQGVVAGDTVETRSQDDADIVGILWRYRWAAVLPAIAGAVIGFLVYTQTTVVYRATTRLMVESDSPAILDSTTGDIVGGVPGIEVLQAQLYSDTVVKMAFSDPRLEPYIAPFGGSTTAFIGAVHEAMILEPEVTDVRPSQSIVVLLHFEDQNAEFCDAAVESFSDALQDYFEQRHNTSSTELIRLIETALREREPKIKELEKSYLDFRRNAKLAWDSDGEAINPHRERHLRLMARRSELLEAMNTKAIKLASIKSVAAQTKDPVVSLSILGQILDVAITIPYPNATASRNIRDSDATLQQLALDEQLVPLMIKRHNFAREFGDNHPTVKQLDSELELMKSELKRIVREQADRIVQLTKETQKETIDPATRAVEAMQTIIYAADEEVSLLGQQIKDLDLLISKENEGAMEIATSEQENSSRLHEIQRNLKLMDQLQEQMARVELNEKTGGTRVAELSASNGAYRVGPNLLSSLGIGSFIGLAFGAGLALMLEKNANTFRNPDEISDMLGIRVLTHVPFFRGRIKKAKKGEINPFKDLDPYLAVVHSPASVAAEAIRSCRTSIYFETGGGSSGQVIQVTSPLPSDGKSTIAGNLACSIAQSGQRVLVIDCDLRRPQLSENFALAGEVGLTNVLNGDCDLDTACHPTPLPSLRVMPSGPIPTNPAEALTLPEMREVLDIVRKAYDYIIIDTPPLLVVTDPSIMASMVDGVVMALRVRRKSKPNSLESINILRAVGTNILGVIINNSDEASSSDGYRGYGYYRYGRYTSRYYRRKSSGDSRKSSLGSSRVVVSGRGVSEIGKTGSKNNDVQPSRRGRSADKLADSDSPAD